MLRSLNIVEFILVERLEIEFGPGFCVLTGETGAGKSILLDALGLALGGRAEAGMVRKGADKAEVVAEFDCGQLTALQAWLAENDLRGDPGVCLLRRTLEAGGRSRAYINGSPVTLQQLKEVGERLVDIHGQHAHYSLLKPAVQRQILDGYADAEPLVEAVARCFRAWGEAKQRRQEAEQRLQGSLAERERLAWTVEELTALRFNAEEWQALQEGHGRLAHAAELLAGVQAAHAILAGEDGGVLARVKAAQGSLADLAQLDSRLAEPMKLLESGAIELDEAAHELLRYADRVELDPVALAQAEARLAAITSAANKFRVKPSELPHLLASAQAQLIELEQLSDPAGLAEAERAAEADYRTQAQALSARRKAGAGRLAQAVGQAMQGLAMQGGRLAVELKPGEPGSHGLESVEFLVSPHAGQGLHALAKTASGGELSRIGLALQTVLSAVSGAPTLIFDEVDAGIGGGVAEVVGRMLAELGQGRQVLCVTHLPQVAARAGTHYSVSKAGRGAALASHVKLLDAQERVEEVARMLGGVKITETTRRHAGEMLAS
ncbi:MAG: DNA repair protein RecN [Betaproteobacteria bacterium]|nr:DNA repair protein RecN [Betaproteobacteria bacterium]